MPRSIEPEHTFRGQRRIERLADANGGDVALRIVGLQKRHRQHEVLRGVDLTLPRGQVAVLIGASGAGKSTVLRCINGLEPFDGGKIVVEDEWTLDAQLTVRAREHALRQIRRRVGMVFQQFNLFPHLSALANVIEAPMQVLGIKRDEAVADARRLLNRVGLGDRLDAMPTQLSGGQQQRVAIARALAMKPRIMLFDEPTSALDPQMTNEVLAVMGDLARDGQTMMVVTHAMNFARKAAHVVHVLHRGQLIESGPPAKLFSSPERVETKDLLVDSHHA